MKPYFLTTLIALTTGLLYSQTPVTDPVADFRAGYDMSGVQKILKLQVDLNNDGRPDVLLAPVEPEIGAQYPAWYVYLAQADGTTYQVIGEKNDSGIDYTSLPSFNAKKYKIGQITELGKYGLLTLISGTGGNAECQLHAIVIEDGGWKDIAIGEPVNAEKEYATLAERFPDPLSPAIEELTP